MVGSKRRKYGNSGQINRVDRISSLPDPIIAHILSFLPSNDAVATSILSSGWKFLWRQVPVIDVGHEVTYSKFGNRLHFHNFVSNLLLLIKEPCLRFCRLCLPCDIDSLYANEWMEVITTRHIKEMHLEISKNVLFPVFTCKKLEVLTLRIFDRLKVPKTVHLPNLRILNLIGRIRDGSFLKLLTSGCPVLEELVIHMFSLTETGFNVCSSTLKKLQIKPKVCIGESHLVIDAPSLEYLSISTCTQVRYYISDISCIREADIRLSGFWLSDANSEIRKNVLKLVNSVAGSTILRLRHSKFKGIQDSIYHWLPVFNNLTCLELWIYESCCCFVPIVLERTPKLVNLILRCDSYLYSFKKYSCFHVFCVPSCLSHSIKLIEIQKFNGSKEAMETVRYLLRKAKVLNKMKIYYSRKLTLAEEMKTELLSFPRGSHSCSVSICLSS